MKPISFATRGLVLATAFSLGACSSHPSKQEAAMFTGAIVGGFVGASLTGGSTIGTLAGAAAGGYVGNKVGDKLEPR